MKSDKWGNPMLCQAQKIRSKGATKKSLTLSAEIDRKKRRKVLDGYPVKPFNMSKEDRANYFTGDSITCLLCGKKYRSIGGMHLQKIHGITEDEYREMYGIAYSQGLSCGDLLKIRKEQGKKNVENGKGLKPLGLPKKKPRVSSAAREARKSNMKKLHTEENRAAIAKKLKGVPKKISKEKIFSILHDSRPNCIISEEYGMSSAWVALLRQGKIYTELGGTKVDVEVKTLKRCEKGMFVKETTKEMEKP